MKRKATFFSLLLVILLSACGSTQTPIQIDFPTIEPDDPTASPTATTEIVEATPTATSSPTQRPTATHWSDERECETNFVEPSLSSKDWLIFGNDKLGMEFEYPPPSGDYQYEYANVVCYVQSADGWLTITSVFWTYDAIDPSTEERERTYFASAISNNYTGSSSRRPTEAIRFRRTSGEYFLDFIGGREYVVEPKKILLNPYEVYALVYNPLTNLGIEWSDELVVVLLFPEGYRPNFEALNIHLDGDLPIDLLEEVVNSVRFLDIDATWQEE
jgi:hypothetical protein